MTLEDLNMTVLLVFFTLVLMALSVVPTGIGAAIILTLISGELLLSFNRNHS